MQRSQQLIAVVAALVLGLLLWISFTPEPPPAPAPSPPPATELVEPSATPEPTAPAASPIAEEMVARDQGDGVLVTRRRGGLMMMLRLKVTAPAGGVLPVEVELRNEGTESYPSVATNLYLMNGDQSFPQSWSSGALGVNYWDPGVKLSPGATLTRTLQIYLPPEIAQHGAGPELWAETRFYWPGQDPNSSDGQERASTIEIGPLPLVVIEQPTDQQLSVELSIDEQRWSLEVVDLPAQGAGSYNSFLELHGDSYGAHVIQLTPLERPHWVGGRQQLGSDTRWVRALVLGPDGASGVISQTLPISTVHTRPISETGWMTSSNRFESLEEAEEAFGQRLLTLGGLDAALPLEQISVVTNTYFYEGKTSSTKSARLSYRLPSGGELTLQQDPGLYYSEGMLSQEEYQTIKLSKGNGYLQNRLGRWKLQWHAQGYTLSLRAPVRQITLEQMIGLAEGVG